MKGLNRLDDHSRVQRVVSELNAKHIDKKYPNKNFSITNNASQMVIDYSNELVTSILEASCLMAKHRDSKSIEIEDVNIILAKKLGIELPYNKIAIESLNIENNATSNTTNNILQNDEVNNKKRKLTKFFDDKSEVVVENNHNQLQSIERNNSIQSNNESIISNNQNDNI